MNDVLILRELRNIRKMLAAIGVVLSKDPIEAMKFVSLDREADIAGDDL
jgi:energy-converting hydrogenase Eha subunit C